MDVYLKTDSQQIYQRNTLSAEPWKAATSPDLIPGTWQTCSKLSPRAAGKSEYHYMTRLSGEVKDCAKVRYSWEGSIDELLVVALDDGNVWWYHDESGLDSLILFTVSGIVLSVITGLILGRFKMKGNQ